MKEEIRNPFNCISSNTRHYHGENKDNTLSPFANIVDDEEEVERKDKHHKHKHDECCCNHHEHKHHHHEESCGCGHHQEHKHDKCCCNHHEHKHHHHEESSGCGHNHEHDHGCGCGCGHNHTHSKKDMIILLSRVFVSLVVLLLAFFIKHELVSMILLTLAYIIVAYDILFNALKNILKGKLFDENFLMSMASLTALIVYFVNKDAGIDGFDGVLVILLYQVGEFFQHLAADKSKQSITKMLDLDVKTVIKLNNDDQIVIDAKDINIDDILLIKPGDIVPTDGIIISGSSSFNTSSLTGESKPMFASVDDKVLSGFINNDGLIKIKALTTYENSTSSKVKKVIEEASKNQAKGERFITKFAKVYTPIVIAISLIVAFIIPLILGFSEYFITYLYKGLTIMVISCPCALVISIPLSYFMGLGRGAKSGVLIKGSSYIENLNSINCLAFDKTGTLTKGNFKVSNISSDNEKLMNDLLYSCEKNFTHPIAKSITSYLNNKASTLEINELINVPGLGIKGKYLNKNVYIGNYKFLKENNIEFNEVNEVGTIIYVSYDNTYLGYVVIIDEIKEDAKKVINELKEKYHISLITGDSKDVAYSVSNKLGIDAVSYQLLPDQKVKVLKQLKEKYKVAYVGDGINDAACLLESNVGIAMKSIGSDIAINASDIVLMEDSLKQVEKVIKISKKTMNIVKQNIIGSIGIKVIVMILAMFIKIPMFVAILSDVGVCLLAILNSLRIMYGKINK